MAGALLIRLPTGGPPTGRPRTLPGVLAAFVTAYAAVLVASLVVFREHVPLEERFAVPGYALAVPLIACLLPGRRIPAVALAALAGATAVAGGALVAAGARPAPDFARRPWTASQAIQEVRSLPSGAPVWSNFPEAVVLHAARPARLLPRPPDRAGAAARLIEDVRRRGGLVVVFTTARRPGLIEPARLDGLPGPVALADALIYRCVTPATPGCLGAGAPAPPAG